MDEVDRIKLAYSRRSGDATKYALSSPGHLFTFQEMKRAIKHLLVTHELFPLASKRVLDVGCGTGWFLRRLVTWGATPENLYGIDILTDAIEEGKRLSPRIDFRYQNAEALPFEDETFDIVAQHTVFTSILSRCVKRNVANEMLRVLKPQGTIIWYDYFIRKLTNRDVRAIGKTEILTLFPRCRYDFQRVTLAPPIARAIAPYSLELCRLLQRISLLQTHYLVAIAKTT